MNFFERLKAPTPKFYKRLQKLCIVLSAGSVALMNAEPLGKVVVSTFTYTLFPTTLAVCKGLFVGCAVIAGMCQLAAKKDDDDEPKTDKP